KIDNCQVGLQLPNHSERFGRVTGFSANAQTIVGAVDQLLETFAEERVIVHDDDAFRLRRRGLWFLFGGGGFHVRWKALSERVGKTNAAPPPGIASSSESSIHLGHAAFISAVNKRPAGCRRCAAFPL